jgi:cardiolipin synthase
MACYNEVAMPNTTWKFYTRPADAWEAMLADCALARERIDVEQYIFGNDVIGKRFMALLRKKNAEGVAVRIMCDAVGSFNLLNSGIEKILAAEGITIKFFNPIQPWRVGNIASWFLRNHRKLLLIDKTTAYTGGVGLEDRMENWRDTAVRMSGPVVDEMQSDFNQMWGLIPSRKFSSLQPVFRAGEDFSFLTNSPRFRRRYIYRDLRKNIRAAKKYIYLTSPYFVPSLNLFTSLQGAARRGVDVRLLLSEASDVRIADIATGSYFLLALHAGIKIYLYDRSTVFHAKMGVIDDAWGSVGSANIDNLSLLLNFEGNIISSHPEFIAELKQGFVDDLARAKEVTKVEWARRPLTLKIMETLTWPIHGIL